MRQNESIVNSNEMHYVIPKQIRLEKEKDVVFFTKAWKKKRTLSSLPKHYIIKWLDRMNQRTKMKRCTPRIKDKERKCMDGSNSNVTVPFLNFVYFILRGLRTARISLLSGSLISPSTTQTMCNRRHERTREEIVSSVFSTRRGRDERRGHPARLGQELDCVCTYTTRKKAYTTGWHEP